MTTNKMYGFNKNMSSIARKGATREESCKMFSIDGLIAVEDYKNISPGGDSGVDGINLLYAKYYTQEQLDNMSEYDNTSVNQYGSGSYDTCVRVELENQWRHQRLSWDRFSEENMFFIFAIKDSKDRLLDERFSDKFRIEEVRGMADKFLHVYEIDRSSYYTAKKCENFDEAIEAIINDSPIARSEYGMKNWAEGAPFPVRYYKSQQGKPSVSVGGDGYVGDLGFECRGEAGWLSVAPGTKPGNYTITLFGMDVYLCLREGQSPFIRDMVIPRMGGYHIDPIMKLNIRPAMIFLDGEDLYEASVASIGQKIRQIKADRKDKFEAAKAEALDAGLSKKEIQQVIDLSPKGKVIATLELAGFIKTLLKDGDWTIEMVKKYIAINKDRAVKHESYLRASVLRPEAMKGYVWLVGKYEYDDNFQFNWKAIKRAIDRAYAWEYLNDTLPGYDIAFGDFDDFIDSLKLFYDEYHE